MVNKKLSNLSKLHPPSTHLNPNQIFLISTMSPLNSISPEPSIVQTQMLVAWHHATQGPQGPPPPPTRSCPLAPVTGCLGVGGSGGTGIWIWPAKRTLQLGAAGCSLTTLGTKLLHCDPSAPGGLRYLQRGRGSRKKQAGYRDVRPGACPPSKASHWS